MKKFQSYILLFITAIFAGLSPGTYAQNDIDKEIVVVKPYQPSLSDAFKINVLPMVSDSISIHPSFDYSIQPKKFDTRFQVRPITAARMVGTPLTKLYNSHLRLGIGNYLTPLAELHINSLRERKSQWGLFLRHYSVNGKLKLDNDEKVKPGFFENSGSIYGKKIFRKSYVSGKFQAAYDGGDFYGYHPSLLGDTLMLTRDDIRQNWLKLDGRLKMGSIHKDSLHLNYTGTLDYFYTNDHYKNFEHAAEINVDLNRRFRSGFIYGLGLGGAYYYTGESIDSVNNTIIRLNPSVGKTSRDYIYRLGMGLVFDINGDKVKPHFYPEVLLQINMVEGILMPYFGLDGQLQVNNYRSVAEENGYITPGLKVGNTNHKIRGFMGVKGSISRQISYDLAGSYSLVDNMAFFVNDTLLYGNTFYAVYDNVEWMQLHGELTYNQSDRFHTLLSVTYDHYKMGDLAKPWHRPNLVISLDEQYSMHNKILVDLGVSYMGKRYAPGTSLDAEMINLKGFVDLNLGIEYRYTKILSVYIRLNNLMGARNQTWNQYPGMGFNVQLGFTYAL